MFEERFRGKIGGVPRKQNAGFLVALGSNLAVGAQNPAQVLETALDALRTRGFAIRASSRFFRTPAYPAGAGPDFVNAAAVLDMAASAPQVLAQLHAVEAEMGRTRDLRWGARTLDLDLIAAGDLVLPDLQTYQHWCDLPLETQKTTAPSELVLPHPRLAQRAFVLVPAREVAPDWVHPVTGQTISQMHDALPRALRHTVVAL